MQSNKFKRNVFRTLSVKTAKYGLRTTARSTPNTNVVHAIVGLNTEVGGLFRELQPYLLGFQLKDAMLKDAMTAFGGISYYTMALAKTLKLKIPGSGKKVHLHSLTKTEALLQLNDLSVELLYHVMGVFHGADMDLASVANNTEQVLDLLWPLIYDLFGVTPATIFEDYSAKLAAGYPDGLFSDDTEVFKSANAQLKAKEAEVLPKPKPKAVKPLDAEEAVLADHEQQGA